MKSIKELGLEIIELQDEVLLVEGDWQEIPYIKNVIDDNIYIIAKEKIALEILSVPLKNCPQIIASTKPREKLALLIIESEAELLAKEYDKEYNDPEHFDEQESYLNRCGFRHGYNKAKEIYKYTETQMKHIFSIGMMENLSLILKDQVLDENTINVLFERAIKPYREKMLYLEVNKKHFRTVKNHDGQVIDSEYIIEPKIEDNKLKGIWR